MDEHTKDAIEEAIGSLTRTRHISVYVGGSLFPDNYIGHAVWGNTTHLVVNCEDGRKVFYLRTTVTKLEENPLGAE
jgi:hypothetical protein